MTVVLLTRFESRPRVNICTCLGVVGESGSGDGVEGEALAVKKEVPVVDATLSRWHSVVIVGGGIAEKRAV